MEHLQIKSNVIIGQQSLSIVRPLSKSIDWNDRLIAILGARGTGKTTLLLQRLKSEYGTSNEAIYITMDDIYFANHLLSDLAEKFRQQGGKILFIDEVHKYPNWAKEIKNICDFYKDLKIVFTGSSIIDINRQDADLSRRAIQYEMCGLSYREFLQFTEIGKFDVFKLEDLLKHHVEIANELVLKFRPIQYFNDYLNHGYYPFFIENIATYSIRVERVVRLIIEDDLQFIAGFNPHHSRKIYQLMSILATNVPFKPNITSLSQKTGIHRNMIVEYLYYLNNARLINTLSADGRSISILQKPDKIFLENTNLHYALAPDNVDIGSLRESFFMNQLSNAKHHLSLSKTGDFFVDGRITFEIGGKNKTNKQIKNVSDAFIAMDQLETGINHKIPLWLFGFLY